MILLHRLRARNFKQLEDITLEFPANGTLLIEGHNEAGKSTLFEAVFFALYGKPLDSDANQDELKRYQAEEMSVELEFSVETRRFTVIRTLRKITSCSLEFVVDGETKTIRNATPVANKIREEISLSHEALLNTCFVAQKNLERLEDLDKDKRRAAINELLNLRVLTRLQDEFKITPDERRDLERRRQRVAVARLDAELPGLAQRIEEARHCRLFTQAQWHETEAHHLAVEITEIKGQQERNEALQKEIREALEECDRLAALITALNTNLQVRLDGWKTAEENAAKAKTRLTEARASAERLPGLTERRSTLESAENRRKQREDDRRESDRLAELIADTTRQRQTVNDHLQRLAELEAALPALQTKRDEAASLAAERKEILQETRRWVALAEWIDAVAQLGEADPSRGRLGEIEARQKTAQERAEAAERAVHASASPLKVGYAVIGTGVLGGALGAALGLLLQAIGLLILFVTVGGVLVARANRAVIAAKEEQAAARSERDALAGERRAMEAQAQARAERRGELERREAACRRSLETLGEPIPAGEVEAAARMSSLPSITLADAEQAYRDTVGASQKAENTLELTQGALDQERARTDIPDRDVLEAKIAELTAQHEERLQSLEAADDLPGVLVSLAVEDDPDALAEACRIAREEEARAVAAAQNMPALARDAGEAEEETRTQAEQTQGTWTELLPDELLPETPQQGVSRVPEIRSALNAERAKRNEAGLRAEQTRLTDAAKTITEQIATRRHEKAQAEQKRAQNLLELGVAADDDIGTLPARFPDLAHAGVHDPNGWQVEQTTRESALRDQQIKRRTLADQQGISEASLDFEKERLDFDTADRDIKVKRRSLEIIDKTRQSIVSRVMPLTRLYMRQLLPLLTDGRYHDVEWDEETNTLSVYDTHARRFVGKRVFSGGARDQVSLALRLAFALATLPGEHNIRPAWLFLDEPLSSFDRSRTLALVDLLTQGLIRRQFAQIFLISHSESFDPGRFDHRIRMEHGSVAENTLSRGVSARAVVTIPAVTPVAAVSLLDKR